MFQAEKCSCNCCQCPVAPGQAVVVGGRIFCSETCAYECTETTCLCIHDDCEPEDQRQEPRRAAGRPPQE